MTKIEETYSDFHLQRMGMHCYPNEFLVRTMLGKYPKLELEKSYKDKKILDLGCGDGRNIILLNNLGMDVSAVEITDSICNAVKTRMKEHFGIDLNIKVGRNNNIPFADNEFDYLLSAAALYYVDENDNFDINLKEALRVLKKGGILIATLPHPDTFILKGAIELGDNHFRITDDPFKLRNGNIFRVFKTKEEMFEKFSPYFEDIVIGETLDDYYGLQQDLWLFVATKK